MIFIEKIENKNIYLNVSVSIYSGNFVSYYFALCNKFGNTIYAIALISVDLEKKLNRITYIQPCECERLSKEHNIPLKNILEIFEKIYNISLHIGIKNGRYKPLINRQYTLNQYLKIIGKYKT